MGRRRKEALELSLETSQDWENLKSESGLVIVDVYTDWAGPCHIMKPIIHKMKIKV